MFQTAFQANAFQNNAFQISGVNPLINDTHDGFTPEEIRRAKNLDRKIREKELALLKAQRADREARKARIRGLVDPSKIVAKQKQNKLQSIQEVKAGIPPVDTTELEQSIAYLENQRSKLLRAVELRREQGQIRSRLAILETQRLAEQDDEESILLLI
jgi:SOS-response transcriptional repressor LexA